MRLSPLSNRACMRAVHPCCRDEISGRDFGRRHWGQNVPAVIVRRAGGMLRDSAAMAPGRARQHGGRRDSQPFGDSALLHIGSRLLLLRLPFLLCRNLFAHGAGVPAIEGVLDRHHQPSVLRVSLQHLRPGHHLKRTPMSAHQMESGNEAHQRMEAAFQAVGE